MLQTPRSRVAAQMLRSTIGTGLYGRVVTPFRSKGRGAGIKYAPRLSTVITFLILKRSLASPNFVTFPTVIWHQNGLKSFIMQLDVTMATRYFTWCFSFFIKLNLVTLECYTSAAY